MTGLIVFAGAALLVAVNAIWLASLTARVENIERKLAREARQGEWPPKYILGPMTPLWTPEDVERARAPATYGPGSAFP